MFGAFILDDCRYVFHQRQKLGLWLIVRTGLLLDREPAGVSYAIVPRYIHPCPAAKGQ